MKKIEIATYNDINWSLLWQNGRAQKSWKSKEASEWDDKASSFAERTGRSPYIARVLSRLPLEKSFTVLDIGSGPGTLALPLAKQVKRVTALDYSQKMLEILRKRASSQKLTNVDCIHCSWESDWDNFGIQPADIAIASRSMNVADLSGAIDKLNSYAKKYAFITDRIAPSPFDPEAFAAIGRTFNSGPDYIFTLNFLYSKGIHASIDILELDNFAEFESMEEALKSYVWMFKDISPEETAKLEKYIASKATDTTDNSIRLHLKYPPRWAMIWWKKN